MFISSLTQELLVRLSALATSDNRAFLSHEQTKVSSPHLLSVVHSPGPCVH